MKSPEPQEVKQEEVELRKYVPFTHEVHILVAPLHVLQLSVQAKHRRLTPAFPGGQVGRQLVLKRKVELEQERQSVEEVQVTQGSEQAVH